MKVALNIPQTDMPFFTELVKKMGWSIESKSIADMIEQGYSDYLQGNIKTHSQVKKRYEKYV